jgi:hypothetical protein
MGRSKFQYALLRRKSIIKHRGYEGKVNAFRPTVVSTHLNRQARRRLFRGLERFANTGDSVEEYAALSKGWPSFWPLDLRGGEAQSLAWDDACHALFLVFRDTLRRVWLSDPSALKDGSLSFLLGLGDQFPHLKMGRLETVAGGGQALRGAPRVSPVGLNEAWEKIKSVHPDADVGTAPAAFPHWKSGNFTYVPQIDFQEALYALFRESWRAKVCAHCSTYFVADKPAQLYCSTKCSNGAHLAQALKWWNEKGASKRAAGRKTRPKNLSRRKGK